ncbi:hypothetical protein ABIE45_003882 [Methylobacterium sp. OAE515]|uniref:hypothetical protein n=1 Tax=Methylobacterium sp. OAE515 TaxID=2817895 RepID=UPI00178A172A
MADELDKALNDAVSVFKKRISAAAEAASDHERDEQAAEKAKADILAAWKPVRDGLQTQAVACNQALERVGLALQVSDADPAFVELAAAVLSILQNGRPTEHRLRVGVHEDGRIAADPENLAVAFPEQFSELKSFGQYQCRSELIQPFLDAAVQVLPPK